MMEISSLITNRAVSMQLTSEPHEDERKFLVGIAKGMRDFGFEELEREYPTPRSSLWVLGELKVEWYCSLNREQGWGVIAGCKLGTREGNLCGYIDNILCYTVTPKRGREMVRNILFPESARAMIDQQETERRVRSATKITQLSRNP